MVYIREAHALDGASPRGGRDGDPIVEEPVTLEERKTVATRCSGALDMSPMTMLIDDMKDSTCRDYAAFPDRLYLVGKKGRIAFAGPPGPRGFDPDLLEDAIRAELGLKPLERPDAGRRRRR